MRVDEEGERALVQLPEPVNKFPEFVGHLVRRVESICRTMGKLRIGQVLARAGLHPGATTVGRILKEGGPLYEADNVAVAENGGSEVTTRVVTAKHPDHVWHLELSVIPTSVGFWIPWIPLARLQRWPFCWWVAVVIDHFSRRVNGFALFTKTPTSGEVCEFLDRATERTGEKSKHIITDRASQFDCDTFRASSRGRGVRPRYGTVDKRGSIAVIERFVHSLETEHTQRILVPFGFDAMRREVALYST